LKKLISIFIALLFINSISFPEQEDIIKEADLLLDIMEYKAAIDNYLKVISENPGLQDIRKKIGYAYFQEKKIDDALKYIKEELELFPDNEDAYDLLVSILFKLDELEDSNNFLEKYDFPARLTEENPYIGGLGLFILGMHFKEAKIYDKAKKYFRKALEKEHDPVKCNVQLIDIELVRGRLEFANQVLKEAAHFSGIQPEFYYLSGIGCFEKSKTNINFLPAAIQSFERAVEINPYFKDALFNLACLSYNFNNFKKAAEYFKRVLEIEPESDKIKFYLDCSLKKLSKSIDKELLSVCPKDIDLSREFVERPDREYKHQSKNETNFVLENINYLGLEFIKTGKFHEAIRRFRNGLIISPESPEINFNLGMVYFWQNNLKKAEKHALIALRRRDFFGRFPAYLKQEIIKKKKGVKDKPLKIPLSEWTFDAALKEGNYFLGAYDFLGTIYFQKGEHDKSVLAYKKVIEINREDPIGHYNLGCAYLALEDRKNAEIEWKRAIKYEEALERKRERSEISEDQLSVSLVVFRRPVAFRAHKSLGRLYLDKNLSDKALKEFKKAIELEPDDPEPFYEVGKIYHAKSERNEKYVEKAIYYYEKYLYLGGEKEEVKELLKSLK